MGILKIHAPEMTEDVPEMGQAYDYNWAFQIWGENN